MNYEELRSRALDDVETGGDWFEISESHSAALVYAVLALAEAVREAAPEILRRVS